MMPCLAASGGSLNRTCLGNLLAYQKPPPTLPHPHPRFHAVPSPPAHGRGGSLYDRLAWSTVGCRVTALAFDQCPRGIAKPRRQMRRESPCPDEARLGPEGQGYSTYCRRSPPAASSRFRACRPFDESGRLGRAFSATAWTSRPMLAVVRATRQGRRWPRDCPGRPIRPAENHLPTSPESSLPPFGWRHKAAHVPGNGRTVVGPTNVRGKISDRPAAGRTIAG